MYSQVTKFLENHYEVIQKDWKELMIEEADERFVKVISNQVFDKTSHEFVDLVISNLTDFDNQYIEKLKDFSEKVIRLGWPLTMVTAGLGYFQKIVLKRMKEKDAVEPSRLDELSELLDQWTSPLLKEVILSYTETWERTVTLQKIALQELTAPLIPMFERVSVMPLVGTIDTERARLIMENLLKGVVDHRAEVVLIDITGVPVVDTMVAHHIIQAADAVRLVGAKAMLVGIRPEIAQTIVNLGIDLNQFITKSTMQKGVEAALELTGRKIVGTEG